MAKLKLQKFQPKEYDEQVGVFEWCSLLEPHYPELRYLFATLNGVKLPIGLAMKMKRAGLKQGPLDLLLPVPKDDPALGGHYCGLWIEMKRRDGGRLSEEQKVWIAHLQRWYMVKVAAGATEAIHAIANYLNIPI